MSRFLRAVRLPAPSAARLGWIAFGVSSLAFVALSVHLPVSVLADAQFDDAWFFGRAHDLAAGRWLGPYSQMTLMKGPGYSIFLALCYSLGVSAILAQALLNVAACSLFARAIWSLSGSWLLAAAVFAGCLWHPYLFPARMIRDDIYAAQTLIYLACLIQILIAPGRRSRIGWSVGAGLSFAWLWMTREEGVWIVPASLLLCTAILWRDRSRLIDVGRAAATGAVAFALVAGANFAVYRTLSIVDFKGAYAQAIDALQSVRVGDPVAYVPVPGKVRERVYAVSPAFASLRPYLERDGRVWTTFGCQVYPSTCGDYAGGWFIWALRDAVAAQGLYDTPAHADAFYRTVAAEVRAACRDGRLTCSRGLVSYLPAITPAQWRTVPAKIEALAALLLVSEPPAEPEASRGDPAELRVMWDFEGLPRRTLDQAERTETLAGEIDAPPGTRLQARCAKPGGETVLAAETWLSPVGQGFTLRLPVDVACRLQIAGAGAADPSASYNPMPPGRQMLLAGHVVRIGAYARASDFKAEQAGQRVVRALAAAFKILMPLLLIAAAAGYLIHLAMLARGRTRLDAYWWVTHALWLLLVTRCAILVLVDISSFPGVNVLYLSAAFPLTVAAALLTIGLGVRALRPPIGASARSGRGPERWTRFSARSRL